MAHARPRLLLDRMSPRQGCLAAAALIVLVALADFATGYEFRLSILYLAPIALAAWSGGSALGAAAAVLCCALWMLSFRTQHFYPDQGFYFWEAAVMLCGFLAFSTLIARLHRALGRADQRLFDVLEEMHAAVYVIDAARDAFVYANSEMHRVAGDVSGTNCSAFESRFTHEGEGFGKPGAPADGKAFRSRIVRDQRAGRWYLMQEGHIPWGSGQAATLKVLTDITEQKNADMLREKHLEMMHQASKLTTLGEIATAIAHEINQPLMAIATYTDACRRLLEAPHPDRGEIAAALGKCRAQAVRAGKILERLREFIRQRRHHSAPCDARQIASEAIEVIRPFIDEERIALELAQPAAEILIRGDRILLAQVLVNLMRNAIDAMHGVAPERRRLCVALSGQAGGGALFSVTDRGHGFGGISPEDMFAPFVTTRSEGLGLGLSISRTIAEAHGGRLWATENPSGGAILHLAVPAGEAPG